MYVHTNHTNHIQKSILIAEFIYITKNKLKKSDYIGNDNDFCNLHPFSSYHQKSDFWLMIAFISIFHQLT